MYIYIYINMLIYIYIYIHVCGAIGYNDDMDRFVGKCNKHFIMLLVSDTLGLEGVVFHWF